MLWLSETTPAYVPTLALWAVTPLLLGGVGPQFRLPSVLKWSADPVLALFLGGFALSAAAGRSGLDAWVAGSAVRLSQGSRLRLLALTAAATALLSMCLSNIAAAAMMLGALRSLFSDTPGQAPFRRAVLVGVALGANFGGMATPVGTGPNAIAIAAVQRHQPLTFLGWMGFALPLTLGMLTAGLLFLAVQFRVRGTTTLPEPEHRPLDRQSLRVLLVFLATVAAWMTEPLHGAPAATVSLLAAVVLFGSGLLTRWDLHSLDRSTLLLIAGGIALGNLLETSGVVQLAAGAVPWTEFPRFARLLGLCLASATLSALMSNTAAATMLIPLAASIDPAPSTAILIDMAASIGIPFVISTPPNAMVFGEGGIRSSDLLLPGLTLMVLGCLLVSLTGPFVLRLLGIP